MTACRCAARSARAPSRSAAPRSRSRRRRPGGGPRRACDPQPWQPALSGTIRNREGGVGRPSGWRITRARTSATTTGGGDATTPRVRARAPARASRGPRRLRAPSSGAAWSTRVELRRRRWKAPRGRRPALRTTPRTMSAANGHADEMGRLPRRSRRRRGPPPSSAPGRRGRRLTRSASRGRAGRPRAGRQGRERCGVPASARRPRAATRRGSGQGCSRQRGCSATQRRVPASARGAVETARTRAAAGDRAIEAIEERR